MGALDVRATACGAAAFAAVALLCAAGGGYGQQSWGWASLAASWAALLAVALAAGGPRTRHERLFLGLLAACAGWALLSATWSVSAPASILEAQRLLVAVSGPFAALALCRRIDGVALRLGVLAAIAAVCTANLIHRLQGYRHETGAESEPVGYANALGLLAAIGILLALDAGRRRPLALAALAPCAAVLVASRSTGAQLALVAGLAVAGIAAGGRLRLAGAAVLAVGAVAAALSFGGPREEYWRVAAGGVAERPVLGSGAGTFRQLWLEERDVDRSARDAHGLYLETLAEQGPVGLALVVAALAVPFAAARRRPLATGAYAAFVLHAAGDWDWELTGLTLAALLVGSSLLLEERQPPGYVRGRKGWLALAAVLVAAATVTLLGALALDRARESLRVGRPAEADRRGERATKVAPWSSEASLVRAQALLARGRRDRAAAVLREAIADDPNEWSLWLELARAARGEERERALARARSLNPLGGA